jgi:hypothetical protein
LEKKKQWTSLFIDENIKQAQITEKYLEIEVTFPKNPYN